MNYLQYCIVRGFLACGFLYVECSHGRISRPNCYIYFTAVDALVLSPLFLEVINLLDVNNCYALIGINS